MTCARCEMPMQEDVEFSRRLAPYAIAARQWRCLNGHSITRDVYVEPAPTKPPVPAVRRCAHCGGSIQASRNTRYHPACAKIVERARDYERKDRKSARGVYRCGRCRGYGHTEPRCPAPSDS